MQPKAIVFLAEHKHMFFDDATAPIAWANACAAGIEKGDTIVFDDGSRLIRDPFGCSVSAVHN